MKTSRPSLLGKRNVGEMNQADHAADTANLAKQLSGIRSTSNTNLASEAEKLLRTFSIEAESISQRVSSAHTAEAGVQEQLDEFEARATDLATEQAALGKALKKALDGKIAHLLSTEATLHACLKAFASAIESVEKTADADADAQQIIKKHALKFEKETDDIIAAKRSVVESYINLLG